MLKDEDERIKEQQKDERMRIVDYEWKRGRQWRKKIYTKWETIS